VPTSCSPRCGVTRVRRLGGNSRHPWRRPWPQHRALWPQAMLRAMSSVITRRGGSNGRTLPTHHAGPFHGEKHGKVGCSSLHSDSRYALVPEPGHLGSLAVRFGHTWPDTILVVSGDLPQAAAGQALHWQPGVRCPLGGRQSPPACPGRMRHNMIVRRALGNRSSRSCVYTSDRANFCAASHPANPAPITPSGQTRLGGGPPDSDPARARAGVRAPAPRRAIARDRDEARLVHGSHSDALVT
jgi:hypothetical protein